MAFNGSGTFVRLYNWVQDAANSIAIRADRMDAEMTGFATGLSNCVTRDGQGVPSADISWAGHKITNLAAGSLAGDAVNFSQLAAQYASGLVVPSKALTTPVTVAFSATPTFDSSTSNVFFFGALTANVTSLTISNPTDGQTISIRFAQDGTGSRTVALPASVHATGGPQSAASAVSWLVMTYVNSASRWEGSWTAIP